MARTTSAAVQAILGDNYGYRADGTLPDLTPFIESAYVTVNRVVQMAAAKITPITLGSDELEIIERWLSAHFYAVNDPIYTSRSTGGASGQFQTGTPGKGFAATEYGRQAIALDYSGSLCVLSEKYRAGMTWLGKPPSQQIPYIDRN
jgi:hypothetical protein